MQGFVDKRCPDAEDRRISDAQLQCSCGVGIDITGYDDYVKAQVKRFVLEHEGHTGDGEFPKTNQRFLASVKTVSGINSTEKIVDRPVNQFVAYSGIE